MKVLLLGSGGREHALAWKLAQSPDCESIFIAPGNAGTSTVGTNLPVNPNDFEAVGQAVIENGIGLVVVGPEEPLVRGIYDYFQKDDRLKSIPLLGPSAEAARLEGSKAFAKAFMERHNIPTAAYREFDARQLQEGLAYIAKQKPPIVLKADGLAAGKGVLILDDVAEAQGAFREMLDGKFGQASEKVVIEAFLDGIEFSVFVLTDGVSYSILPVAKDYKRVGEGDTGLNTGGMGAVSPPPFVDEAMMAKVEERIIKPTLRGLKTEDMTYRGFIFLGLIRVEGEPYVIEYNCRMGDPETQVVIPRLKSDLLKLCHGAATARLGGQEVTEDPRAAATVILVSGGYPEAYKKGVPIVGLDQVEGSIVFHAGTAESSEGMVTNGGRVLAITSLHEHFREALQMSYRNAEKIHFEGKYARPDIGFDL